MKTLYLLKHAVPSKIETIFLKKMEWFGGRVIFKANFCDSASIKPAYF
jgi:hypothetical protein